MNLSLSVRRFVSALGVGSALLILAFGWRLWLMNGKLGRENAELRKAVGTPIVIRNLEFDIVRYMTPVASTAWPQSSPTDKLMLFAKDTCPYCAQQLPIWKDFVDLDKDAEIWLISLGQADAFGDMSAFLAQKRRSYREFRVPAAEIFSLCTGIRSVPTTIITRENRVRLVYFGVFTQPIRDYLIPGILAESSGQARFPGIGPTSAILE